MMSGPLCALCSRNHGKHSRRLAVEEEHGGRPWGPMGAMFRWYSW